MLVDNGWHSQADSSSCVWGQVRGAKWHLSQSCTHLKCSKWGSGWYYFLPHVSSYISMCDVPREESVHADLGPLGSPPAERRHPGSSCAVLTIMWPWANHFTCQTRSLHLQRERLWERDAQVSHVLVTGNRDHPEPVTPDRARPGDCLVIFSISSASVSAATVTLSTARTIAAASSRSIPPSSRCLLTAVREPSEGESNYISPFLLG